MRPKAKQSILLSILATLPQSTSAHKNIGSGTPRRRRRRRPAASTPAHSTKLLEANSGEALRDRWAQILSLEQGKANNSVRLDSKHEQNYYYEAEVLADKLLGLDDIDGSSLMQRRRDSEGTSNSLLSNELSVLWKSVVIASSVMLIGIPVTSLFKIIITSDAAQTVFASIQRSITPYIIPTISVVSSSTRNFLLHAEAQVRSMPYLMRNLNHIKIRPWPFLIKLMRRCIILEAWRHVWTRFYKLTRYLWRGTLSNAKSVYFRWCPPFIRRGIKSMFQSSVQGQVHGVFGGVLSSVLSGVTFESWAWSPSSLDSSAGGDSVGDSQSLGTTIQDVVTDSVSVDGAVDAMAESAESALDDAVEAIISEEIVDTVVDTVETSLVESAVESAMEDCLSDAGDCLDVS